MARIDKFLWSVRLFKTRTLATTSCKEGKVRVNDTIVKSSRNLKIGDKVTIRKQGTFFSYKVLDLLEKRVGAKLVENYIINITPQEELEKHRLKQLAQKAYRAKGEGRPTKRDRRLLDEWDQQWDI